MKWEAIDYNELRAKITGGWLVKIVVHERWDWRIAICFVPDPDHSWKLHKQGEHNEHA